MQIIVFTKEEKFYGIRTADVGEIIKDTQAYHVPQAPVMVRGLINLRGSIITLIEFAQFIGEATTAEQKNIIVIANDAQEKIGLLVEDIVGVYTIDETEIQPIESSTTGPLMGITQLNQRIVNLIDVMTIFTENEG